MLLDFFMVLNGIYIYECIDILSLILLVIGAKQCSYTGFNTLEHIGRLLLFNDLLSVSEVHSVLCFKLYLHC